TDVRSRQKLREVVSQPSPPTPAASAKGTRHQRVCAQDGADPRSWRGGYGSGDVGQPFLTSGVDVGRNLHGLVPCPPNENIIQWPQSSPGRTSQQRPPAGQPSSLRKSSLRKFSRNSRSSPNPSCCRSRSRPAKSGFGRGTSLPTASPG